MKSPLEQIDEIDNIIAQLQKIGSLMYHGQVILAYREVHSLIAYVDRFKKEIITEEKSKNANKKAETLTNQEGISIERR